MEGAREVEESKRFRWVGRLSEEEPFGPASARRRRAAAVNSPPPPHIARPLASSPADPFEAAPRWRFEGRDLIALAAVAAAVWFAIRGADGLPFQSHASASPEAADLVAADITLDRRQLASLPKGATIAASTARTASGRRGAGTGDETSSGTGSKHGPKPPPSGDNSEPLVQATIPGVGTVTLDNPELPLPTDSPSAPLSGTGLTDTAGLLPDDTTVAVP